MAKIRVSTFDTLASGQPDLPVENPSHGVVTQTVFGASGDPIHTRLHHLPPASTIGWADSPVGHLCYVWEGAVDVGGTHLAAGSMIAVEHGSAQAMAHAGPDGAMLLVFNRPAGGERPERGGGHVHLLPADRVRRTDRVTDAANVGAAIFANSACPTCALWLHESLFFDPNFEVAPHLHTEDEVIVVTAGELVLGTRRYGRGTAVAVDKDTVYRFRTGPDGLTFINFRPCHPTYATPDRSCIIDEQALYLKKVGRPAYLDVA